MTAPTFTVDGDVAKVMCGAATALFKQPGHHLLRVATGDTGFLLGVLDVDAGSLQVFDGPALIAALRKPVTP